MTAEANALIVGVLRTIADDIESGTYDEVNVSRELGIRDKLIDIPGVGVVPDFRSSFVEREHDGRQSITIDLYRRPGPPEVVPV
jgi:hypothetical protein